MLSDPDFVIQSQRPVSEVRPVEDNVERILGHYCRIFMLDSKNVPPISIILGDQFDWYGSGEYPALYKPSSKSIRFMRKPDTMLLLHEIAHHFIQAACGSVP
ncbi:MAG: hypothetical protein KJ645_02785, partial [Planctomycetes bacterium]|nr:hypothetical protein [Planctomycetota bacterium]